MVGDNMTPIMIGIGIILVIVGIAALFIPALTRLINFPGNERIKALVVIVVGIIFSVVGYLYTFE